jgi:hypothetical protein
MGQHRKPRPSADSLLSTVSRILVPEHILEHFEIYGATESASCWVIELREKEGLIPVDLLDFNDVVFDGYCNPVEVLSHSFVCKPVYLKAYRRRYKRSGSDTHCSNSYELSLKGVRMVPELGLFLKTED